MDRNQAVLIIGPTGSGKTPLGEAMESRGLRGRPCHHFDFGDQLRSVGQGRAAADLFDDGEIEFIDAVLKEGVLLEDQHFYIAERLLRSFLERRGSASEDVVILNGMPRHIGQAARVDSLLQVSRVISLSCTAETVLARIAANSGGDRSGRTDDRLGAVGRKLVIFRERTQPLIEHYRASGARAFDFEVGIKTCPADILSAIEGASPC